MRIPSGIEGFDEMVQGGLPLGSTVIAQGPSGTEKLAFGLQFLAYGLKNGEAALAILSAMSPSSFLEELGRLGVDVNQVQEENRIRIVDWYSQREEAVSDIEERGPILRASIDLANVSIGLSKAIAGLPDNVPTRGLLEILSPALRIYDLEHVYSFAQSCQAKLHRFRITSICLIEKEMHDAAALSTLQQPFDGVVEIDRGRVGDEIVRKIAVLSLKDTLADSRYRSFRLEPGRGLVVTAVVEPSPTTAPVRRVAPDQEAEAKRRVERFLRIAEERIEVNPKDADAWFAKTAALASMDRMGEALESLVSLAKVDESYPGLWIFKAKLHARLGQAGEAKAARMRAIEMARREEGVKPDQERTVPCPVCETDVREGDPECPNCGALLVEERRLVRELESLAQEAGRQRIREEVDKKAENRAPQPPRRKAERPRPKPTRPGLTNGLVREGLHPAVGRTNGLTNGLRGRTNGLTNGLRGRTNGLTNGLRGRTNGLTNGLRGRTNGLTNGLRGRTNGLTNGLGGRTNGLVNGLRSARSGLTNGLTNGSGFTNGLGSGRFRHAAKVNRWKLYLVPLLSMALLLVPLLAPGDLAPQSGIIVIDGDVSDWNVAAIAPQTRTAGLNPNVDIIRFGIADNVDYLAFFVEVNGSVLRGGGVPPTMDVFRVFLDTDNDRSTGYRVDGLGADHLVQVSGWGGAVNVSSLYEWDANRDAYDWRGWIKGTPVAAAAAGGRLETQVDWLAVVSEKRPVVAVLHAQGFDGGVDKADHALRSGGGSLLVVQTPVASEMIGGANVQLLRLALSAFGAEVGMSGLTVTLTGSAPLNAVSALRLVDGAGTLVDERIPVDRRVTFQFPERTIVGGSPQEFLVVAETVSAGGDTLGVLVAGSEDVAAPDAAVTVRRAPSIRDVGYLGSVPTDPRIDGGFSEWTSVTPDAFGDGSGRPDPDVDLTGFAATSLGNASFLYAEVGGRLLSGVWVPEANGLAPMKIQGQPDQDRDSVPDEVDPYPFDFDNDGTPDSQTGGDYDGDGQLDYGQVGGTDYWLNTTIPATFPSPYAGRDVSVYIGPFERPFTSREDILRVFVDLDDRSLSGYAIGGLGADRMVEVSGTEGRVRSTGLFAFTGTFPGQWSWSQLSNVSFALGFERMEFSVPENLTAPGTRLYVEIAETLGSRDSLESTTRGTRGAAPPFPDATTKSSFQVASAPTIGTRGSTLIDGNSNAVTTQYNHQRKVVRAGDVAGDTACDATNSDGCWYAVFYDQFKEPTSAFLDGSSVAVGTTETTLGSLSTSLPSGDNLVIVSAQFESTDAGTETIAAGNFKLKRGGTTLASNENTIQVKGVSSGDDTDKSYTNGALLYRDAGTPASPTYDVTALASATGMNGEVKILVINGPANSDFGDGASVSFGTTETTILSKSTTLAAGDNAIVAVVQLTTNSPRSIAAGNLNLMKGGTVLATNEFQIGNPEISGEPTAILLARDAGAGANPTYNVTGLASGTSITAEAKLLVFNGLTSAITDTGSVAIGTSETTIGTLSTTFASGDNVVIAGTQFKNSGSSKTVAAGDHRLKRGATTQASNQLGIFHNNGGTVGDDSWNGLLYRDAEAPASAAYDVTAIGPATGINGEAKILAVSTPAKYWDRIILMRSSDTGGSTWGSQIILASGRSGDSPLLYSYDSSEPSIAIDSSGYLHVVWVSASATGDQSTLDRVRYTKTKVTYPTQSELATAANWGTVETVDDTNPGFMPTVSTDSENKPHLAWSGSKTSGTVYYKNKAGTSVAVDAATSASITTGTTLSWSHTTSGSNRLLVVGVSYKEPAGGISVSTVQYGGQSFTQVGTLTQIDFTMEMWRLLNPPTGTNTVYVNFSVSASKGAIGGAVSFTGVDQTNPLGTFASAGGTTTTATVNVASAANEIVIDTVAADATLTVGAGQTQRWNILAGDTNGGGSTETGATTVTMSWSLSVSAKWAIGGVSVKSIGVWSATVSWGTKYTGISVDVSPQTDYVSLTRYYDEGVSIAFDAATSYTENTAATSFSFSHTTSGVNRLLIVGVAIRNNASQTVSSVDYNNKALTFLRADTNGVSVRSELWYVVAPDTGANTVRVNLSASAKAAMGTITLTGVDQSNPTDANNGGTGTSTGPSVAVTTVADNAWVVDAVAFRSTGNSAPTGTVGAGQTERWSAYSESGGSDPNIRGKGSTEGPKTPAGAVTMDWTLGASVDWALSGASFKPMGEIQYVVCKDIATSLCDASGEFTKFDGTAGFDTVATAVEPNSYPSLATTYEVNGDLWVAYAKDVDDTTRAIYARFLDYPSAGWGSADPVDSLAGTLFARPSIGIDSSNTVHALYVASSGPQLYYNSRSGGSWGTRIAIETSSDNPTLMVRAPNDETYGTVSAGLYWKTSTSETYFFIPEFQLIAGPILAVLLLGLSRRRSGRRTDRKEGA